MRYQYAFLVGDLIMLAVWLFFYLKRKDLRKAMLWSSIIVMILSGLTAFLWMEYWHDPSIFYFGNTPGFSIENFIYGFVTGGISTVVYEFFERKKLIRKPHKKHAIIIPITIFLLLYLLSAYLFPTFIAYDLTLSLLLSAAIIAHFRKDLVAQMVGSALIFGILYFLLFALFLVIYKDFIPVYYHTENLIGIYVFRVPIEEFFIPIGMGAFFSVMYEYSKGYRTQNI